MRISTTCRLCGKEYEPSKADIYAGNWRTCEDCREARAKEMLPRSWTFEDLPREQKEKVPE